MTKLADPILAGTPTRLGRNGGRLLSGNPKAKGGSSPSWIREQLRQGLAKAVPILKAALATRRDPITNEPLSWQDYAKLVDVAGRHALPAQNEFHGEAPFTIQLIAPGCDEEARKAEMGRAPLALPGPR